MIELDRAQLGDLEYLSSREWLETNGIGGYASGAVSGANSRRYHGLLVAAVKPPLERMVLLSKFEETLVVDGEPYELSSNRYPGAVYPDGYKYLTGFRLDPFPIWTFSVAGLLIEKRLFMVHGENTTVVTWTASRQKRNDKRQIGLEVRPLLAFRDHHQLQQERADFGADFEVSKGAVSFRPITDSPTLFLSHNSNSVDDSGNWYRNFEYSIEQERGFDFTEDLFQPCVLRFDLSAPATVVASTEKRSARKANEFEKAEMKRRAQLIARSGKKDDLSRRLVLAADQFIVDRGKGKTVIAGYHWFSDWGRDTMIALPGLTLATNRPEIAKSILSEFSRHISEGMLPNRFPDAGETPEYNTVDATLWFFEAIRAYAERTGDHKFVRSELYDKLVDIIEWHIHGTRYQIHVDTDGLLYAGEPGVQLTWMDAKIGDWVVTPRTGKAVEIQALWYNALCIMADFATRFEDKENQAMYTSMADVARSSFTSQFWNETDKCLFDVVNGAEQDASIRPNQIFAASLPYTMLNDAHARMIVEKVEVELLTPVGLRSLSPNDPRYVPIYIGSPFDRDASYHQGTVWAWLIGPFIDAYRRVHKNESNSEDRIGGIIDAFRRHLTEAMVGQVSEIFDGDPPHLARGCAAQAWSVAELLRVLDPAGN